jgi:high-affinity iron transporter
MRYQARTLKSRLEHEIEHAVSTKANWGLSSVTFLAVFREGVETALFLSAATFASDATSTLTGAFLGLGLAAGLGYAIYASSVRLNLRLFFNATSVLLLIFAAGLLAHALHEFQEASLLPFFENELWNTANILDSESTLGEIMGTIIGYTPNPSLLQGIGYITYWVFALVGVRWLIDRRSTQLKPAAQMSRSATT